MFSKSLLFIAGISSVLFVFGRPAVSARSELQSHLYARDVLNSYLDIEARDLSNEVAELMRRSLYTRMAPIAIKKPPPHPAATPDSHQGSSFGVTWGQDHLQTDKDKQKAMLERLENAKANDPPSCKTWLMPSWWIITAKPPETFTAVPTVNRTLQSTLGIRMVSRSWGTMGLMSRINIT